MEPMFYARFLVVLSVGLIGLSMVLMRLMDTLFAEWDVVDDVRRLVVKPSAKAPSRQEAGAEEPEEKPIPLVTRMHNFGQGRGAGIFPEAPAPEPSAGSAGEASAEAPAPITSGFAD